jgi:dienelactone hydrolase
MRKRIARASVGRDPPSAPALGTSVPAFKRLLQEKANFAVTTVEYAGASHAFNHKAPPEDHWDPVAIGHRSHTAWNADAANDSLGKVVSFLRDTLTAK